MCVDLRIPPIPDWRKYKVEMVPDLLRVQRILAQDGLKDPWLRNEVWRYPPNHGGTWPLLNGGKWPVMYNVFFRGFKYGFAAFVLTVVGEKIYTAMTKTQDGDISHH